MRWVFLLNSLNWEKSFRPELLSSSRGKRTKIFTWWLCCSTTGSFLRERINHFNGYCRRRWREKSGKKAFLSSMARYQNIRRGESPVSWGPKTISTPTWCCCDTFFCFFCQHKLLSDSMSRRFGAIAMTRACWYSISGRWLSFGKCFGLTRFFTRKLVSRDGSIDVVWRTLLSTTILLVTAPRHWTLSRRKD